jgi:hypothetical protein
MRFEAKAAVALGILLPVLETYRRGFSYWRVESITMLEDYLAGALLLTAAWTAYRRHSSDAAWLLTAWAAVAGMMAISFGGQVETTIRGVDIEPNNPDVLVAKFLLLAVSLAALVRSFARVARTGGV